MRPTSRSFLHLGPFGVLYVWTDLALAVLERDGAAVSIIDSGVAGIPFTERTREALARSWVDVLRRRGYLA
jgi:hypothetical protein